MKSRQARSRRRLDHIPLTVETLRAAYDYLASTPPFVKWNLPPSEDVSFKVAKDARHFGWCTKWSDGKSQSFQIAISAACIGHTDSLMRYMAHEVLHLHQYLTGQAKGAEHNEAFYKDAAVICRIHGFDAKAF